MPELLCHLFGDYILQNHLMANLKTKSWAWAATHALLYTLPFLLLTRSPAALAVILGTHAVIDRHRLARYWVEFWGVGQLGWASRRAGFTLDGETPPFLAVWLLILVDNTFHLAINHLALAHLA
jgi:hypothetical protein